MTMVGGTLSQPFIISGPMCFANNPLVIAEVLSTLFFVSGLVTFLQATFGVRLVHLLISTEGDVKVLIMMTMDRGGRDDAGGGVVGAGGSSGGVGDNGVSIVTMEKRKIRLKIDNHAGGTVDGAFQ